VILRRGSSRANLEFCCAQFQKFSGGDLTNASSSLVCQIKNRLQFGGGGIPCGQVPRTPEFPHAEVLKDRYKAIEVAARAGDYNDAEILDAAGP
jgi:hypothetical protein